MSDLLIGCRAKIQRAEENVKNLKAEINAFLSGEDKPYQIIKRHQNNGLQYAFVALGDSAVPPRFAVLTGEIIHHLRSTLDHLFCALVIKNGGTPTRQHQFPIYTSRKKFDEACSRGLLKDISRSAEKVIRSLQPYTSETPDDTIFYVLQQYDNLDKHQLLLVVCTVARLGQKITIGENAEIKSKTGRMGKNPIIIGLGDPRPRKITKDGVVVFTIDLGEPAPELEAEAEFVPQVAFEKCGRAELIPVTEILPAMLQATANCVNALIGEF